MNNPEEEKSVASDDGTSGDTRHDEEVRAFRHLMGKALRGTLDEAVLAFAEQILDGLAKLNTEELAAFGASATRKEARGKINDALLEKSNEIGDLLAKLDKNDIMARQEIGRKLNELQDESIYGGNAIVKCAKHLHVGLSYIYGLVNVARAWPDPDTFAEIMSRTNRSGVSLKWSHLVELSRVWDADRRQNILDEALEQGLSAAAVAVRCTAANTQWLEEQANLARQDHFPDGNQE